MSNLLRTKPIDTIMTEATEHGEHSLRRALGPINLITLGIGAIIGTGIFVLTGQSAATPGTEMVLYAGRWSALRTIRPVLTAAGVDPATLPHVLAHFNLVAFVAIAVVTTILVIGVRESANVNSAMVMIKLLVVFVFIGLAASFVLKHPEVAKANWHPFMPPNAGAFGAYGWSGIARGAAVIFFAYIGFDAV